LTSGKIRRSSPLKRAEFFMRVKKDGVPYLNIPLVKSHYLIGRGQECEINLKGTGIPVRVGELSLEDDGYVFKSFQPEGMQETKILPDAELVLYNYEIKIEELQAHK
jgi:hypothetical protein